MSDQLELHYQTKRGGWYMQVWQCPVSEAVIDSRMSHLRTHAELRRNKEVVGEVLPHPDTGKWTWWYDPDALKAGGLYR